MRITDGYQNMFRIPELKQKLLFTAMILIIYRLGTHIPVPGVDTGALAGFFDAQRGTLLGLYVSIKSYFLLLLPAVLALLWWMYWRTERERCAPRGELVI